MVDTTPAKSFGRQLRYASDVAIGIFLSQTLSSVIDSCDLPSIYLMMEEER